jgi:uncharacterized damage-inducible protein DinB
MTDDTLRFPTGRFQRPAGPLDAAQRAKHIETIAATPRLLTDALRGLTEAQVDSAYRPGGWTVRQVAHHLADSHMNAYVRVKLALTESAPAVTAYDENAWAQLPDSMETPADVSLSLLTALHDRWTRLLRSLKAEDFQRTVTHPEHGPITVDFLLALYAWHGPHHVGHVKAVQAKA